MTNPEINVMLANKNMAMDSNALIVTDVTPYLNDG
jgi:hypothetical protein